MHLQSMHSTIARLGMQRTPYQLAQADAGAGAAGTQGGDAAAAAAGATGASGANGSGGQTPEMQAAIQAAVDAAVTGLKAKNSELLQSLAVAKEVAKRWDGIGDPEQLKAIVARFTNDEEGRLIAAGKIDEVLAKRTERMKAAADKDIATARADTEKAVERAKKYTQQVMENHVRGSGLEAGIHPHAYQDAFYRANQIFELDDDGKAVAREGNLGKDGQRLTLKEWFADMKDKAPHWWPAAQGGGANASGNSSHRSMTLVEFQKLSAKERSDAMASGKVTLTA